MRNSRSPLDGAGTTGRAGRFTSVARAAPAAGVITPPSSAGGTRWSSWTPRPRHRRTRASRQRPPGGVSPTESLAGPAAAERSRRGRGTDRACDDDDGDGAQDFGGTAWPSACCARCSPGSSTSPGCCPRPRSGRGTWSRSSTASRRGRAGTPSWPARRYAVASGKAPSKRNAETMAVEQVMRWRSEVSRFAPDRLEEFDELIADALNNPAPVLDRRRRPRAVAGVRASTGLTTHRPTGARVRAWCHSSQDPTAGRDPEPVCEPHDSTGEPGAGDRPAGFGERGEETYPWVSACGPARKRRKCTDPLPATRLPSTLHECYRYPGFERCRARVHTEGTHRT